MKRSKLSKYNPVALPVGVIVVIVLLALAAGSFLVGKIQSIQTEILRVEASKRILSERVATLQSVPVEITQSAKLAAIALPPDTPGLYISQQLKTLALENDISIDNFTIERRQTDSLPEELSLSEVNFEAEGEFENMAEFILSLGKMVPVTNLGTLTIEAKQEGGVTATVRLSTFSSPFPEVLPSITEPIKGLTDAENETLELIDTFRQPQTVTIIPVNPDPNRTNPYTLDI